jgi:uncharacterized membrane protein
MPSYILAYVVFAIVFGLLDLMWLSVAVPGLYRIELGPILAEDVRRTPAALFYLAYVAGAVIFVVAPSLTSADWRQATWRGAAFGLVAYATYDLTNQATLKMWSTRVSAIDMAWGACATAIASAATVLVSVRIAEAMGWR